MSRFFSPKFSDLTPYVPGEQPQDQQYTKLNTNESPFPPSPKVIEAMRDAGAKANLYNDPTCRALCEAIAGVYGVAPTRVHPVNGSDEILNFAIMAFCDEDHPLAYADITYGCYPVFAEFNRVPSHIIPLNEDFTVDYKAYCGLNETIVIANPNAPTGMVMPKWQIEEILRTNPDNVVIIDEAYVAFGAESCVDLVDKYDNLLVAHTFSKSHSLAGARLGFGIAQEPILADINTIKYSTNPYNVNRMAQAAGAAAMEDNDYYLANCRIIQQNRAYTTAALEAMGFTVLPSFANFIFAKSDRMEGGALYEELKRRGVLVRHFNKERISDYLRISIGTMEQMEVFLNTTREILDEKGE